MNSDLCELIAAWLKKAEHDLKTVKIILEASEENITFPKTHLLSTLLDLGTQIDPQLSNLSEATKLSPYGATIRYPDDYYLPNEQETRKAREIALSVQKYVLDKLREYL